MDRHSRETLEGWLTHKEVENLCDLFMEGIHWNRVARALIDNKNKVKSYADRIYTKDGDFLAFEIKPENALDEEVKRGIGQLACFLPYQIKPYLVLSEAQWDAMGEIINFLPWLGVIVYGPYDGLRLKKKSRRDARWKLLPVGDLPTRVKKLKYDHIYSFVKELKGSYSAQELVTLLKEAYPDYKVSRQNIGSALNSANINKKDKDGLVYYEF